MVLNVGDSKSLTATVQPVGTPQAVVWSSSDTKVATVSSVGLVKSIGAGTCDITATASNGVSAACKVTVKIPVVPPVRETWDSTNMVALWEGDSLTANEDGRSFAGNLQIASGSVMKFSAKSGLAGSEGTGGHKLENVLADVPQVLADNPKLTDIFIHCGTNDYSTSTAAQALEKAEQIIKAYNAANVKVHWLQILPRVVLSSGDPAKYREAFNAGLQGLVAGNNLHILNADEVYDPTDTTLCEDGTHATSKGARILMKHIADTYFKYTTGPYTSLLPKQRMVNPTLAGTEGVVTAPATGTLCKNYVVTNASGADVEVSMVPDGSVFKIRVDITGSATSQGLVQLFQNNTNLKALAGQAVEGGATLSITSVDGNDPVGLQAWALADIKTGGGTLFKETTLPVHGAMPGHVGPARIIPKTLDTDATAAKIGVSLVFATGPVNCRLEYSAPRFGIYELDV
ncbi:structural protein with Ig domain [Pseudomonas phage vB_PpuP-Maksa]